MRSAIVAINLAVAGAVCSPCYEKPPACTGKETSVQTNMGSASYSRARPQPTVAWAVALFSAFVVVVARSAALRALDALHTVAPTGCPAHPASCLFSTDYISARTLFRDACAKSPHCTLTTVPLPRRNGSDAMEGEDLTIDFARVGAAGDDGPLLLHVSGTHGAEGHAGSAIQLAALRRMASGALPLGPRTTVLFVHALNPYGFAHGRRFNERNVDLNRNALFPDVDAFAGAFARLQSDPLHVDGYDRIAPMLNDASGWQYPVLANARFALNLVGALLNPFGVGYVGLKRCIVAGQYHDPTGLYYGGVELEASHAVLIRELRAQHAAHRRVIFLDVHSGLGEFLVCHHTPTYQCSLT